MKAKKKFLKLFLIFCLILNYFLPFNAASLFAEEIPTLESEVSILGTINYSGEITENLDTNLRVRCQEEGSSDWTEGTVSYSVSSSTFAITGLSPNTKYKVQAYLSADTTLSASEPSAYPDVCWDPYNLYFWIGSRDLTDINISLRDKVQKTIRGKILQDDVSESAFDGATVTLINNIDGSEVAAQTTSAASFSVAESNEYNYEFADVWMDTGIPYNIEASKSGSIFDKAYFSPYGTGAFYVSDIIGRTKKLITVTNFGIGAEHASNVTITPTNDWESDFADVRFTYADLAQGSHYNYRFIVDTNNDGEFSVFNWGEVSYTPEGMFYEGTKYSQEELDRLSTEGYDWSMDGSLWNSAGGTEFIRWEGRNQRWQIVPNGTYKTSLQIIENGWWNDSNIDDFTVYEDSTTVTVTVETTNVSGTVLDDSDNPVEGARVNMNKENGGGWGEAFTNSSGEYTVSGLAEGTYWSNVQAKGYNNANERVTLSEGSNTGHDFVLEKGGLVTGTISIGEIFEGRTDKWGHYQDRLWGNVNAWSKDSPNYGWANFEILKSSSSASYELSLPPGVYNMKVDIPDAGYVSAVTEIEVTKDGLTQNITLEKGGTFTGTVSLPEAVDSQKHINIDAFSTSGKYQSWGWGQVESGESTGTFEVQGIMPNEEYNVRIHVDGYVEWQSPTAVTLPEGEQTYALGTVSVGKGITLTGTLTIDGSTENLLQSETNDQYGGSEGEGEGEEEGGPEGEEGAPPQGAVSQEYYMWVDAWSHQGRYGRGTSVSFTPSSTTVLQTIDFRIEGLKPNTTYELHSWLDGFDIADRPVMVEIEEEDVVKNLTLEKYSGQISGTITGVAANDKPNQVIVFLSMPWRGDRDPASTVADSNGEFSFTGLETGEYVVTANHYSVINGTSSVISGDYGEAIQRVNVANKRTETFEMFLSRGNSLTVTVTAENLQIKTSQTGREDYDFENNYEQLKITVSPLSLMRFGGGGSGRQVMPSEWDESSITATSGSFTLEGLTTDTYVISISGDLNGDYNQWDPQNTGFNDVVPTRETVFVSGSASKNVTINPGYMIAGVVERTRTGKDFFGIDIFDASNPHSEPIIYDEVRFFDDWSSGAGSTSYENKLTREFEIGPIAPGDYVLNVRSHNGKYKPASKLVKVEAPEEGDVIKIGNIKVEKGATIKGKLLDKETGDPLTEKDVYVECEARPWVEGSHRNTDHFWWSDSMEEDDKVFNDSTGEFYLRNLPAGSYFVRVVPRDLDAQKSKMEASTGSGSKKFTGYVGYIQAGVKVPDSTETVDIGTIQLYEGVKISGRVVDADGTGLANVRMMAQPVLSDRDQIRVHAKTDADGYYIFYGIDPNIDYWEVIAARRAEAWEGIRSLYGEKIQANIVPGAENIDFVLERAVAGLTGTVTTADGGALEMPFKDSGMAIPGAMVLLQKQGQIYTDPMDGIEIMTLPNGVFNVTGIVGGNYNIKVMSKGYTTYLNKEEDVITVDPTGTTESSKAIIELQEGGTVSGTVVDAQGNKVTTSDIDMIVAVQQEDFLLTFGNLNVNYATNEIESYSVEGLEPGVPYSMAMVRDDSDDVRVTTTTVTLADISTPATFNIIYQDLPPTFIVQVTKQSGNADKFDIGVFSTEELTEVEGSDVISLKSGNGALSDIVYAASRTSLSAVYTLGAGDTETFVFTLTGTDVNGSTTTKDFTVNIAMVAMNENVIQNVMGGKVILGGGDVSGMQVAAGGMSEAEALGGVVKLAAQNTTSGAIALSAPRIQYAPKAYPFAAREIPSTVGTLASQYYEFTMNGLSALETEGIVTIQYSSSTVTSAEDLAKLNVYYYDETAGEWIIQSTNRVLDTDLSTIAASTLKLGQFAAIVSVEDANTSSAPSRLITYIYPSPYYPARGNAVFRYKLPGDSTKTVKGTLKVYNLAGELVKTMFKDQVISEGSSDGSATWDGRNDAGRKVASGVYLYVFKAGKHKQIKKFAVIK